LNRRTFIYICTILLFFPVFSAPLSSQTNPPFATEKRTIGYNITETYYGIIKDLEQDENQTSFTGVIGLVTIYSVRDGGGIAVGVGSLRKVHVTWSNEFVFQGLLRNHVILGRVKYRIE
jgi:hypothetical protein